MAFIKKCLICKKPLFKQYDVLKYKALNNEGTEQIYESFICKNHILDDEVIERDDEDDESI